MDDTTFKITENDEVGFLLRLFGSLRDSQFMKESQGVTDPCIQCLRAICLYRGRGCSKDVSKALQIITANLAAITDMAGKGKALAQFSLGGLCKNGVCVKQDDAAAVEWFRKAAEQGLAVAQNNLGCMYANGQGVEQNDAAAVEWYRKAAERGDATAQNNLGVMYANGRGVEKDEKQAVEWYRKAAEQGYAAAQFNLGWMYADGRGVEKDEKQAVEWYRKAAEQGLTLAQDNLGWMYFNGCGVKQDDKLAFEWFRKAAEQGNADAQFVLGWMYFNGCGVDKDVAIALDWFHKAADQGNVQARINLERLDVSDDADAISAFATERGITRLVHFTTKFNLIGILKLGKIMPRSMLERYKQLHPEDNWVNLSACNDAARWDGRTDFINLSIEHINTPLFRKFSSQNGDEAYWCIIEIDPRCLREKGVLFTMANASSTWVRKHGTASGLEGLKALYRESFTIQLSNGDVRQYSRNNQMPRNWPTCNQAEVLFPGALDLGLIKGVTFMAQDEQFASSAQTLFEEKYSGTPPPTFTVNPYEFC